MDETRRKYIKFDGGSVMTSVCNRCSAPISGADSPVFDERLDVYYCDTACFRDWAADNIEAMIEFYEGLNVGG